MPQYLRRRDAETLLQYGGGGKLHLSVAVQHAYEPFPFPGGLLRRFGYTDDTDLLARDEMDTLIHPEDLLHTRRNFDAILLGNEINSQMSFRLKSADGSYEWWEFRSTAYDGLTVDTPYMVLGVCQSIQRYKDTEEALIAARDRALQADKLKSAFLANMSHEIRTL